MSVIHVTGHKGLVGSSLTGEFNSINYPEKILNRQEYENFLIDNKIDTIIHAAGRVGGVLSNSENRIQFYLQNSNLSNIVFEAALNAGINNLVNFSSTCIFPNDATYPLTEDQIFGGPPHVSNDGYAYAKRMMQYLCKLAKEDGKNFFTIIPTNCFGPNDNFNTHNGHFLPSLIHKCYLATKNNTDLIMWGTGNSLREFLYSKDLAKITRLLIEAKHPHDSIIVSTSEEISIKDCTILVAEMMGFKGNIIFDTDRPEGQFRKPTDNTLLKSVLPDFKFTPFEQALSETIEWFMENYDKLSPNRK